MPNAGSNLKRKKSNPKKKDVVNEINHQGGRV